MKRKNQLVKLLLVTATVLSPSVFGSDYAKISDRVIFRPESGKIDSESLKSIIVCEVLEINGREVERQKAKKSGDPPYVLVPAGTHRLKVLKKRAWGLPGEKGEIIELNVSVEAGLIYTIKDTEHGVAFYESKNE